MSMNCIVIPQHLLLLVRCTHQSMPILMTLLLELRVPEPTVGGIQKLTSQEDFVLQTSSTVMVHNLNWLMLLLDQSNSVVVVTTSGLLVVVGNCCLYFSQESPWLPSHCTIQWQWSRPSQTEILCCTTWLWCLGYTNCKHPICRYCFSPTRWRVSRSQEYQDQCQL